MVLKRCLLVTNLLVLDTVVYYDNLLICLALLNSFYRHLGHLNLDDSVLKGGGNNDKMWQPGGGVGEGTGASYLDIFLVGSRDVELVERRSVATDALLPALLFKLLLELPPPALRAQRAGWGLGWVTTSG